MRSVVIAALMAAGSFAGGGAGPASAVEVTMADACSRAAELFFSDEVFATRDEQSFPDERTPRVKLWIARKGDQSKVVELVAEETGTEAKPFFAPISCTFSSASPPFGLTEFCPPETCFFVTPDQLKDLQAELANEGL